MAAQLSQFTFLSCPNSFSQLSRSLWITWALRFLPAMKVGFVAAYSDLPVCLMGYTLPVLARREAPACAACALDCLPLRGEWVRVMRECGLLFSNDGCPPVDESGCRLPSGHDGPHEFTDPGGGVWLWETDWSCGCEHCLDDEGDLCTVYWPKRPDGASERIQES